MRSRSILVIGIVVVMISITMVGPIISEDSDGCVECHSGFNVFPTELVAPTDVPTGEEFELALAISNPGNNEKTGDDDDDGYPHDLRDIEAELDLTDAPNLELVEGDLSIHGEDIDSGDEGALIWRIRSVGSGEGTVSCTVSATAYYKHNSNNPDTHRYTIGPLGRTITVKPLPVRLSTYSLSAREGKEATHEVLLTAKEPITNITITPSTGIQSFIELDYPQMTGNVPPRELGEGDWLLMHMTLYSPDGGAEGVVSFNWTNFTGEEQFLNLSVVIIQESSVNTVSINWFSLSGQVSGFLLLFLFASSVIFGGFPNHLKRRFMKIGFNAKRRIDFHCQISYLIIGLVLFHMLVLLAGPWWNSKFELGVILGYVGLALFLALGLHGHFQRPLIRKFGYKVWLWGHRGLTLAILILALIHAVRIGTHFEIFR